MGTVLLFLPFFHLQEQFQFFNPVSSQFLTVLLLQILCAKITCIVNTLIFHSINVGSAGGVSSKLDDLFKSLPKPFPSPFHGKSSN